MIVYAVSKGSLTLTCSSTSANGENVVYVIHSFTSMFPVRPQYRCIYHCQKRHRCSRLVNGEMSPRTQRRPLGQSLQIGAKVRYDTSSAKQTSATSSTAHHNNSVDKHSLTMPYPIAQTLLGVWSFGAKEWMAEAVIGEESGRESSLRSFHVHITTTIPYQAFICVSTVSSSVNTPIPTYRSSSPPSISPSTSSP